MELWVRSQDKTRLVNIVQAKFIDEDFDDSKNVIKGDSIDGFNFRMGKYKSKERALEVLDEIQNILMPKTILRLDDILDEDDVERLEKAFKEDTPIVLNKTTIEHLDTYVYEMPEE